MPVRHPTDELALVGATLYASPEAHPRHDATILIRDGKIAEIGSRTSTQVSDDAAVLDCSGCAITAGFWNSHVHFHERKWANADSIPAAELVRQLAELTRYGFTNLFDLSSSWENTRRLRDRIESGEIGGPFIRSTGEGLIPTGGTPSAEVFRVLGLMDTSLWEVSDAAQAREASKKLLAQGVDALKLFLSAPTAGQLPPDAIRACVEEAHRAAKPVFAHPNAASDIIAALEAGVDFIAHTSPRSGPWSSDVLDAMQAAKATLIPTLMVWQSMMRHDRIAARDALVGTAVAQLRAWLERGGTVLFGTDLGAVEYDPTDEYELMWQAGATFRGILASLTTTPAQRFDGEPTAGKVAVGRSADLVVLNGDPSINVRALASVRYTLRGGEIIYQEARNP
ncbi:MAG: amidohydrolase family protein [Candidatus Cybelea sp.]